MRHIRLLRKKKYSKKKKAYLVNLRRRYKRQCDKVAENQQKIKSSFQEVNENEPSQPNLQMSQQSMTAQFQQTPQIVPQLPHFALQAMQPIAVNQQQLPQMVQQNAQVNFQQPQQQQQNLFSQIPPNLLSFTEEQQQQYTRDQIQQLQHQIQLQKQQLELQLQQQLAEQNHAQTPTRWTKRGRARKQSTGSPNQNPQLIVPSSSPLQSQQQQQIQQQQIQQQQIQQQQIQQQQIQQQQIQQIQQQIQQQQMQQQQMQQQQMQQQQMQQQQMQQQQIQQEMQQQQIQQEMQQQEMQQFDYQNMQQHQDQLQQVHSQHPGLLLSELSALAATIEPFAIMTAPIPAPIFAAHQSTELQQQQHEGQMQNQTNDQQAKEEVVVETNAPNNHTNLSIVEPHNRKQVLQQIQELQRWQQHLNLQQDQSTELPQSFATTDTDLYHMQQQLLLHQFLQPHPTNQTSNVDVESSHEQQSQQH